MKQEADPGVASSGDAAAAPGGQEPAGAGRRTLGRRTWGAARSGAKAARGGVRWGAKAARGGVRSGAKAAGGGVRSGVKAAGKRARSVRRAAGEGTSRFAAQVLAMAPKLPVRDREALLTQFPGKTPEHIGDSLIDSAAKASAAVGGAVGAWATLPVVPAFPVEVATETLALVAIEIKLVAELHELYGVRPAGSAVDRMTAYVAAWATRRGVALAPGGLILAAGSPLRKRLQRRLAARAGRSAVSLGPLLTGAAAGALVNRWETRRLGEEVHSDLRRRLAQASGWYPGH